VNQKIKKFVFDFQKGSISLSIIGLGVLIVSAVVLPAETIAGPPSITPTISSSSCTIQGIKHPEDNPTIAGQEVKVSRVGVVMDSYSSNKNPYYFYNLDRGKYNVSVPEPPPGYVVGYTLCSDRTDCHTGTKAPGRIVEVDCLGRFVDLHWWYFEITKPACNITAAFLGQDGQLSVIYSLRGNNDKVPGLFTSSACFYREAGTTEWHEFGKWREFENRFTGSPGAVSAPTCSINIPNFNATKTYEVAAGVMVYFDSNGNGSYDRGELYSSCSGRNGASGDCSSCFRTVSVSGTHATINRPVCNITSAGVGASGDLSVTYHYEGNNTDSLLLKLGSSCFYRKSGDTDWIEFSASNKVVDADPGTFGDRTCTLSQIPDFNANNTYEVASGVTVYFDSNGNGYDTSDPHVSCTGRNGAEGDCSRCFRAISASVISPFCQINYANIGPMGKANLSFQFNGRNSGDFYLGTACQWRSVNPTPSSWQGMSVVGGATPPPGGFRGGASGTIVCQSSGVVPTGTRIDTRALVHIYSGPLNSSPTPRASVECLAQNIPTVVPTATSTPGSTAGSCPRGSLGDINCDGSINGGDLAILAAAWGKSGEGLTNFIANNNLRQTPDLNGSGGVGGDDLAIMAANWGR